MFARLVFLFVTIPLVEIYLLLQLYEYTGNVGTTIGLVLLTGIVGAWLAKQQGLSTVMKIQQSLSQGRLPAQELMDGGMILFAGALLLTPGILTDAFGFSLLFPPCRVVYRKLLKRWFPKPNVQFQQTSSVWSNVDFGSQHSDPNTVDGEARTVEPRSFEHDQKSIEQD